MSNDPATAEDPVLDAEVERQLTPYRQLLPVEAIETLRSVLLEALTDDAVFSSMMRRLRPVKPVMNSGERPVDESPDAEAARTKKPA